MQKNDMKVATSMPNLQAQEENEVAANGNGATSIVASVPSSPSSNSSSSSYNAKQIGRASCRERV